MELKNKDIERKLNLLMITFGNDYKEFKNGNFTDDRRLFVNVFEQVVKMLGVSDSVYGQNTHLDVAIDNQFRKDFNELEAIQKEFIQ